MNEILYGKDRRDNITGVEMNDENGILYFADGTSEEIPHERYIIYKSPKLTGKVGQLHGDQAYKFFSKYPNRTEFNRAKWDAPYGHCFVPRDDKQSVMLKSGITMYGGMKYEDLGILSIDIETSGLTMDDTSEVFMISASYQKNGKRDTRLFSRDDYLGNGMINAFMKFVQDTNPDVITGHNIIGYDLPYMTHVFGELKWGRDDSPLKIANKPRLFRKDGHRAYDYNNIKCFGREIVDTFYLAMKYDFKNKYNSYGLKSIIDDEGLTVEGRQFYDSATIKDNWHNQVEREKIKEYCEQDSEDALNLCDLMLRGYFYYSQMLPNGLQETIMTASGTQINNIMVRSYLQNRKTVPRASESVEFVGAISDSNPGIYDHVNKVDVASLYPSIILQYKISDFVKDPDDNFLSLVGLLTVERLNNKQLAKDTGDRYYSDLEQAQKIIINSAYGFLGAKGLNFNNPANAALITKHGRKILTRGMKWVEDNGYQLVNVDTDSFSYTAGSKLTEQQFDDHIAEINGLFPSNIIWENDGQMKKFVVVKTKNYVTVGYDDKVIIKGSGLKATMKEPALQEFLKESINCIVANDIPGIELLYMDLVNEIRDIQDISRWCSKKTVTKAILKPTRTNEERVKDAFKGQKFNEGDRIYTFFETIDSVCLLDNYTGNYDMDRLLEKLYKTVKVLDNVIDISVFKNYKLKKNKKELETLGGSDVCNINELVSIVPDVWGTKEIKRSPKTEEGTR